MRVLDGGRQIAKAAGAATAAAPYMRRLVDDQELRESLRSVFRSASRLYDELDADDRFRRILTDDHIRKDVDHMLEAMQDAGRRVVRPRRNWGRIVLATTLAGALTMIALYAPARTRVMDAMKGTSSRANEMVRGGKEKASEMADKAAEATASIHQTEAA
jgi:hypothetical protein